VVTYRNRYIGIAVRKITIALFFNMTITILDPVAVDPEISRVTVRTLKIPICSDAIYAS